MKKASQLEKLRSKYLDKEVWDASSKHAERELGCIGSAGIFDENGVMLSEPWSDALLFAPVVDGALMAKRQAASENRKKDLAQRDRAVYEALVSTKSSHVNLNNMNLTSIPSEFFSNITLRNVRVLSLAENLMSDLPAELFSMVWITQLKLMHNKLTKIPDDISKLKELRILWIQHNMLASLPHALTHCVHLSALDFSANQAISFLPLCYASMTNLTLLCADECAINTPPPTIMAKSVRKIQDYLQRLIWSQESNICRHSDIKIITIPDQLFEWMPNLTAIDVSHCGLRNIQEVFYSSFCLLESMNFSHNLLQELSPHISLLTQLTFLDISTNLISVLPTNIGFLPLQTFNYLQKGMTSDPIGPSEFESKSRITRQYTIAEWRAKRSSTQEQNSNDSNIYDLYGDLTRAPLSVFLCFLRELELCKTTGTIDFGCMFLQRVPEALMYQDLVQNVILRQNQLIMIPHAIGQLMPLLQKLDLSENALCELPDSLSCLSCIQYIDISKNCFNTLGVWLSACTSLTFLNIEDNNIDSIPKSYRTLQNMQVFRAQNNKLSRLPRFIGGWPQIGAVSVWNPILIDPPPEISTRTDSETHLFDCARYIRAVFLSKHAGFARLSRFNLLGIPSRFSSSCQNLKVLDLSENSIRSFPVWISILTCLEALNLSYNFIAELPDFISSLTALCSLNLNNNPIEWLPSYLVSITSLREVSVLNCDSLRCPNAFACSRGWLAENGMQSYMSQIWCCQSTHEIDLSGYDLLEIDLSPYSLTSVTELYLDDNKLESFPSSMANMFSLSRLHASNNQFQKWPLCGWSWQKIVLLNLSLNALESVPKDIQCMTSLERLMLSGNRLISIAPHIGRCIRLTHVTLRDNPNLHTIPLEFGRCSNIQALSMSPSLKIPQFSVCSTRGGALFQPYMSSALFARSSQVLHLESLEIESVPHELFSYSYPQHIFFHDALNEGTLLHLNLSHNRISTIPHQISLFCNLKVLNLGFNQISSISNEILSLSGITDFNVQNNCIESFPRQMFKDWIDLTSLDFSSNRLSRFPAFLFTCISLQVFVSFGNPWTFPNINLGNRLGNNVVALIFASHIERIAQSQDQALLDVNLAKITPDIDSATHTHALQSNRPTSAPDIRSFSNEATKTVFSNRPSSSDSKEHSNARSQQNQGIKSFIEANPADSLVIASEGATHQVHSPVSSDNRLELIGYGIEDFPQELLQLTSLTILNLRNNVITEIPNRFTCLSQLIYINFSQNRFHSFPSVTVHLRNLVGLDLSFNFLSIWPQELFQLSQLVSLNLSHNFVSRIPDRIASFSHLRVFLVHGNQINYLPRSIYFLTKLTALNVSSNPTLQIVPCELGTLKALHLLFIDNNSSMYSPPVELHGVSGKSNLHASRYLLHLYKSRVSFKLDLVDFGLISIPSCPFKPSVMLYLLDADFSRNKIQRINQDIVLLARLQTLNLSYNFIEDIGLFLTSLSSLRSLDVSYNQIRCCGAAFMMWKLQEICLSGNSSLTCLTCALVDGITLNCICHQSGLNASSAWCTSLKELRCDNTSINHLPRSLARSRDLAVLNFENSSIQSFHSDILQCKNLYILKWSGCPSMEPSLKMLLSQGLLCVQMFSRRLDAAVQSGLLNLQDIPLEDIPFLPQELCIWSDILNVLKASGLPRQHLPSWLPELRVLSSIFVENCGLSRLSSEIFKCKMLRELYASNNNITEVYIEEPMKLLEILNLSHNRISVFNLCDNALPLLSILIIHHNFLLTLPENLKHSFSLRHIDCSFCLIRHWPQSLHYLQNAEFIDISHNSLHSFTLLQIANDNHPISLDPLFLSNLTSLNLSHNLFSSMPEWLENCHSLCEFRAIMCRCTSIPWRIALKMNMKAMEFDQDKVTDPPNAFSRYGLHGIKLYGSKLHISSKRRVLVFDNMIFQVLPASMFSVHNLLKLSLKHCSIPEMSVNIVNLTAILSLTLNSCHLLNSPSHIHCLTTLLLLDLGGNDNLRELDIGLSKLKRLQNLNISHCSFENLPKCVLMLTSLTILDCSHNSLNRIPNRIGRLIQLVRLHAAHNNISSLPPTLGCCSYLRIFEIDYNPICWLPWQIGQLDSLIRISTTGIKLLPPLDQLLISGGVQKLKKFLLNALIGAETGSGNFSRLQISSLSPAAALLGVGLTSLDLSMNNMHLLPNECGLWTSLKRLNLSRNSLVAVHNNIDKLFNLKHLRLSQNRLFAFPDVSFNLTNLKVLDLSKNRIQTIPAIISCMYFLIELNLSDNSISELPDEMRFCSSLCQLKLVRNHIKSIPESLSEMKNLLIEVFDGFFYALPLSESVQHSLEQKFQDEEIVASFDVYLQNISKAVVSPTKVPLQDALMAELFFVSRLRDSEQQFTSGSYYLSAEMQIQEKLASFKVPSALFEQFLLSGLSLIIQIWIKTKKESKLLCFREIKLLPSMCSGIPFVLNMNEIVAVNEPGSFMSTFAVVTQGVEMHSDAFQEASNEELTQLVRESVNLWLPEWNVLDFTGSQVSHLLESDAESYENERFSVQQCLLSAFANRKIQISGAIIWSLPDSLCRSALFESLECLELNFCPIKTLTSSVSHLINLKTLNLSFNQLNHIDHEAFPILKLEFLQLQRNSIIELPESIGSCYSLKLMDASSNMLQTLPLSFGKCLCLETLNFAENPMSCLPNSIFSKDLAGVQSFLQSLSLQFSKNVVSFQDFGLSNFQLISGVSWEFVRELNLSKNVISDVSENVLSCLNRLLVIDLSDNPINGFPPLWCCPSVTHIHLHHTQINEIPIQVRRLVSVEYLDLSWCQLTEINDNFALLVSLKEIVLSGNNFGSCTTLNLPLSCTQINLSGAGLSSIKLQSEAKRLQQERAHESVVRRFGKKLLQKTHEKTRFVQGHIYRDEKLTDEEIVLANEVKVDSLRVKLGLNPLHNHTQPSISNVKTAQETLLGPATTSGIRIDNSPSVGFHTIAIMNLAQNEFEMFAYNLACHHPIEELDMKSNRISELVINLEWKMHQSLQFLDLSHNQIAIFPSQLLKFPKLRTLLLDHNRISSFSLIPHTDRRAESASLRILSFHHNQISSLPDILFGLCSRLAELWIHSNNLINLPPSISSLRDLQTLTLSSNRLKQLPDIFTNLPLLNELWIQQNPLTVVPPSIFHRKIQIFLHSLGSSALNQDS